VSKRRTNALGLLTQLVPFGAPIVAMAFGLLIGGAVGWYARAERDDLSLPAIPAPEAVEGPTSEEGARITGIRERVAQLEELVADQAAEVADLQARLEGPDLSAVATSALEAELARARRALAGSRRELQRAQDRLADGTRNEDTPDR